MKKIWKPLRTGLMLLALPLVATAAASAHHMISESAPLSSEVASSVVAKGSIGVARVHTVALNRNGAIEGRIASFDQAAQTEGLGSLKIFFVQNGKVAQETTTSNDGTFIVQGLAEGAYSFIATGANGFAAYGLRVVTDSSGKYDNVMEAAAVSPRFSVVKQILESKLPREVSEEIANSVATDREVVGANRVRINNGSLKGRVATLAGSQNGTFVHVIQNDIQIAEVQTDEEGNFLVNDLEPGVYDFVAAGPNGFAAISFEAVEGSQSASVLVDTTETPVSQDLAYQDGFSEIPFDAGYSNSLDVCLTCQNDSFVVGEQLGMAGTDVYGDIAYDSYAPIEYASEAIGCGCAAGASCGTAGNFSGFSSCNSCGGAGGGILRGGAGGGLFGGGSLLGGGGGLGRLALLGGLAVGVVAIADDDDPQSGSPFGS